MSSVTLKPVARGLNAPRVLFKWLGGHHDDSDWKQMREIPCTDFRTYALHPLFHQVDTFDEGYLDEVKALSTLWKPETLTPFKMSGDFAAGPISSKWPLDFIWDTGRLLHAAVHQYIARRVWKIFDDLLQNNIIVSSDPYVNLEIWFTESGYILKYKTTFVKDKKSAIDPESARIKVIQILALRAQQRKEPCASYVNENAPQLPDKGLEYLENRAWHETMTEAHFLKDSRSRV